MNNKDKERVWRVEKLELAESALICSFLLSLASNEIAAIQIPQFLSEEELALVVENMRKQTVAWYANKENKQGRIGISATEYHYKEDGKRTYFDLAPQAAANRDQIFEGIPNPIGRIIKLFSEQYGVSIATEPSMQDAEYFAGIVRAMGAKSTLHFDYAQNQLPGWSVSDTEEQFGLVLHLQAATEGGELSVYNRPWEPEDESNNKDIGQKGTYGFTEGFLGDTPHATVKPSAGDLIVFRSRNFHQVEDIKSDNPRLTLTVFMSLKDGALYLWS
jgi:hypothetical protein